ncbi:hypothetical protein HK104_000116 [Borealophlyctis nickersoniae]|nr:hypothetical protein HK104_000116 [Borealophlyctis nickersoniae]
MFEWKGETGVKKSPGDYTSPSGNDLWTADAQKKLIEEGLGANITEENIEQMLRLIIDMQRVNKVTIRDAGSVPSVDDFVENFTGYTRYSGWDPFASMNDLFAAARVKPNLKQYNTRVRCGE